MVKFIPLLLAAILTLVLHAPANAQQASCPPAFEKTLACTLDTLSWVQVSFQTDIQELEEAKSGLERLIRLRMRNDMSFLQHEVKSFNEAVDEFFEKSRRELRRRGQVGCTIWTVGDDYPVAMHVECKLSGYGVGSSFFSEFETAGLGYSSAREVKTQAEDFIREQIQTIASDFFETRDLLQN